MPSESVDERWGALWSSSPQRSPYSHLAYVRAVAEAADLRLEIHFVEDGGRDTAGAAVLWRRRGPFREVIVPPFTPFSAVLLREAPADSEIHNRATPLDALLRRLESSYDAVHLHLHPSIRDVRTVLWRGWDARPLYTYVAELVPASVATEDWSGTASYTVRTASGNYQLEHGDAALAAVVDLASASYDRHDRKAALPNDGLKNLLTGVVRARLADTFAVRNETTGKLEAAAAVAIDDRTAYYWIAGSFPGDGMTVLLGKLLPRLYDSGIRHFDFVGANVPSIAEFKRKFGCRLTTYYRSSTYASSSLKLLDDIRGIFR